VGEWVLAIGNPFGLEHTVTSGIVSAKGRHIGTGPYDNFIQTDASINPGNSGGPLINMRGEVVGINTAIFSRGGGNIGIGFAIPINLVKELLPQLKEKGKVTRGWLGVVTQRVTPAIAESFGLEKATGALIVEVSKDGPAEHGGVKVGDVIIEFDGKEVKESNDLPIIVARTPVGTEVSVRVLREGKEVVLSVTIGELKEKQLFASPKLERKLGLTVQEFTPQIAESLGLEGKDGVVVTSIEPGGPGDEAGFRPKDVILEIDRQPIGDLKDFRSATAKIKKGKSILFLIQRGGTTLFLAMKSR
jgi:serine protease Do